MTGVAGLVGRRRWGGSGPVRVQLLIVPLIDMVFLLLAFFLLTADFRESEGFLPAAVGQVGGRVAAVEVEPLWIGLEDMSGGGCLVRVGDSAGVVLDTLDVEGGLDELGSVVRETLVRQGRLPEDPVRFQPGQQVLWEHVVRVYDVLWRLGMDEVVFVVGVEE